MRSQNSDRQGRRDSERNLTGGDRRGGFDRDYDRHSQRRHRDQDRDMDFGSDMSRDYDRSSSFGSQGQDRDDNRRMDRSQSDRSQYGSQDFNSSSYGSRANYGSDTGYRPRSESGMGSMEESGSRSSWGLQGDRGLQSGYGSYDMDRGSRGTDYDDIASGQSHWGMGQYSGSGLHDRDNYRRDTRRHDDRSHKSDNFFERLGEKVGEFFGKGPKGYKRSDDRIKEDVSEALWAHPSIDASDIEIDVKDGLVTLSGTVTERRMKRMIEDEIEHLPGVKDVINNVRTQDRQSNSLLGSDMSSTSSTTSSGLGSSGSMNMNPSSTSTSSNGRTSDKGLTSGSQGRKTQ